ncbi:ATP-grasp domain-containing protein [Clostridium beijerinckii]|uniref:ATP-grasp domain-containing protein n=1 Tax=Clostridium beijerinckii TaxID=1520 RepID=UPI001361916B|nr:ATP-grasp domain-containing protein [Clostridium beijerinckii]MZK49885.1 ATP-grasp domain-containing protein [Clostridium beijerinckii]MZK57844.1 ATP-grasp domain-containing protein [Clostridium beijerinckii]MZK68055.1 ATP-grasp domain-containing protein [Clostridium beijerinckii]MZK73553.1 ATP-grasp domain-containing protein [Clostridium beijerinckii]MZK83135.1 ATP-grasp domain-containing protein [Clostridium beijerinckii]
MNLLITSIGKRVQLIKHLKESFNVVGVDAGEFNPAKFFVNKFYKIPKAKENGYIESLLDICKKENINVLIPLYEGEFENLHNAREKFKNIGTVLLLSNHEILNVCKDKKKTYEYFLNSKINIPKVYFEEEIKDIVTYGDIDKFPLIIKPRDGMGSEGIHKINSIKELVFFKEYVEGGIIQEFIEGDEYTVDALVDLKGNPVYVVPRRRLEVRAGEVVKSSTVKDKGIINETLKVIEHLNRLVAKNQVGLLGPLTIQFFKKNNEMIYLLEINPRFGGGVPLSFEGGANYGQRILEMVEGKNLEYIEDFKEITMLRYEEAVYF